MRKLSTKTLKIIKDSLECDLDISVDNLDAMNKDLVHQLLRSGSSHETIEQLTKEIEYFAKRATSLRFALDELAELDA